MAGFTDWRPPAFSPTSIPTLPSLGLSESERQLIGFLQGSYQQDRSNMVLTNSYYMGAQQIPNLQIAIPDELAANLRTLVGWAAMGVDPYVERTHVDGFRIPGETDVNEDCARIWDANGMDAEFPLCVTDALAIAHGWLLVGVNADGSARMTVESPLSVRADFATDGRTIKSLMQTYTEENRTRAAIMLPDQTIQVAQDENGVWELVGRDVHNMGFVSARRMANNPRTDHRQGYSEITPALMSVIDSACRRLMGLEASSELYSLPRLMILGASAEDFQDSTGAMRKAWDTYVSKINVIERDEDGQVPELKQLTAYDPSVFTKVLEMYASQAAGILRALPQDLGLYTDGNPISVDSFNAMDMQRNRRTKGKQRAWGPDVAAAMKMALRFENGGTLPAKFERLAVDWAPPEEANLTLVADALSKLTGAGIAPRNSDVVLKRAGFNPVERAQMAQDMEQQRGDDMLNQILSGGGSNSQQQGQEPTDGSSDAAPAA